MTYNVLQYLEASATGENGDRVAFADNKTSITYTELVNASRSVGTALINRGITKGAIAVIMQKSSACFFAYFAAVYAGCFYVPVDDMMPIERINLIFDTLNPSFVLYDQPNAAKISQLNLNCEHSLIDDLLSTQVDDKLLDDVRTKSISTDPVYALFTSGSTGVPKGVIVNHSSIIAYAEWLADTFEYDRNTVFGNQTPFYFSMSVHDIFSTIKCGCTMQIIPKKYFSFPGRLSEYLCEKKVNTIYWVPTAMCLVADSDAFSKRVVPDLQKILFAGEVMPTKQLNYWISKLPNALYVNMFGPTEITDIGVYYVVNRKFADDEPLPIGQPCLNCGCLVLTDDMRQAAPDEEGELCIRGAFLAMGYYNNPERTASVFVQNPLNPHYPEIIYKTGDLVKYNEYGELMFVGRKDFQIKHMGYRIELGEIETALGAVDGVVTACCVYDDVNDRIVCFYKGSIDSNDLLRAVTSKLPQYMVPSDYIKLNSLPMNANGKIDRKKLRNDYVKSD